MGRYLIPLAWAVVWAILAGCRLDTGTPPPICDPDAARGCTCQDGATGEQRCKSDGSGWRDCSCPVPGEGEGEVLRVEVKATPEFTEQVDPSERLGLTLLMFPMTTEYLRSPKHIYETVSWVDLRAQEIYGPRAETVALPLVPPPDAQLEGPAAEQTYLVALVRASHMNGRRAKSDGILGLAPMTYVIYRDGTWTRMCIGGSPEEGFTMSPCESTEPVTMEAGIFRRRSIHLTVTFTTPDVCFPDQCTMGLDVKGASGWRCPVVVDLQENGAFIGEDADEKLKGLVEDPVVAGKPMLLNLHGASVPSGWNCDVGAGQEFGDACLAMAMDTTLIWLKGLLPALWLQGTPLPPGFSLVDDVSFFQHPVLTEVETVELESGNASGCDFFPMDDALSFEEDLDVAGRARISHPIKAACSGLDLDVELVPRGKAVELLETVHLDREIVSRSGACCWQVTAVLDRLSGGYQHGIIKIYQAWNDGRVLGKVYETFLALGRGNSFYPREAGSVIFDQVGDCFEALLPPPCGFGNLARRAAGLPSDVGCDSNEAHNPGLCPRDCGVEPRDDDGDWCGDGLCDAIEQWEMSCPEDCGELCGNGVCNIKDGEARSCPQDCTLDCASRSCEDLDGYFCQGDCVRCGDWICSIGEMGQLHDGTRRTTCPEDCWKGGGVVCGDDRCSESEKDSCPNDCFPYVARWVQSGGSWR